MEKHNILEEWFKNNPIPLEIDIKVSNEVAFINLITELGYREDKMWNSSEDDILNKLVDLAADHTNEILSYERKFVENFVKYLKSINIVVEELEIDKYFKINRLI